ncbi:TPA: bifunctional UDP-4-amino-4-deoxy-L-arabinose formyltransferase/UDP-glucuronic acid oxidase ArnA [Klebsiella pneumoniae]|uniref:bifunctional UDP-4-amino-4-deoxy-L-arabinose formyltransferase/UDP-glucuronic acid oxidase ArnA n=1 Tax=Klebsiella pneumoniae TaxID=573 RepID=UPI000C7D6215|nr:bifunctional UDP-4-amino-4-deoxy-L-arabinose formyltransferase/UDP-glucuronic acid oxidase ArnA [Klebsiella pneumoniae]AUH87748.1 hypothetical protein CYE04_25675 [Klebsiella pneumoniae]EKV5310772.1 bifunctional UDP-4-amino-4-deoxy-L-arabinose formyltransferase/UDP-glucuronic acid oxidase ArnA [Klebsiella pneumoniae]HBS2407061.1 bifunctional UDP-4-amino-4-deoxy-L-arabinose formyltransferase/UDP-glucuronic acid oxidase ArnA [Klebsiella pneumoniae]
MKAVVFAYHDMGCTGIQSLLDAGYDIAAIFTHPDNPGENHFFGSVARLAAEQGIPVWAPEDVNHPLWIERIREMKPDVLFSFYYRNLLGDEILNLAPKGAFNLHGSLLPKYRGRAPLNWVLVNGESETGVTLHRMVNRADAGDIVAQQAVAIGADDAALTLHRKLCAAATELLSRALPAILAGTTDERPQDHSQATYVGRRTPEDGRLDWELPAQTLHNLVRAVSDPWPGAFGYAGANKFIVWKSRVRHDLPAAKPGTVLSIAPLIVACQDGALEIVTGQTERGVYMQGAQLAQALGLVSGAVISSKPVVAIKRRTRVLILGVNGFIGNHLTERLLQDDNYEIYGLDIGSDAISRFLDCPRFHFVEGDISIHSEWIEYHIKKCDVVLPLVAIATPIEYTRNPLRVFELDFEENLKIIRDCVKYNKRIIFPSTSEVYGMCTDKNFDEDSSNLVEGSPIKLIEGGKQKRCFTDISDGIEALFRIIENKDGRCDGQIINIGNPDNEASIKELAEMLLACFERHPLRDRFPPFAGFREVESSDYYGKGYQDVEHRKPSIRNAKRCLNWEPKVEMEETVEHTLDFFLRTVELVDDKNP